MFELYTSFPICEESGEHYFSMLTAHDEINLSKIVLTLRMWGDTMAVGHIVLYPWIFLIKIVQHFFWEKEMKRFYVLFFLADLKKKKKGKKSKKKSVVK